MRRSLGWILLVGLVAAAPAAHAQTVDDDAGADPDEASAERRTNAEEEEADDEEAHAEEPSIPPRPIPDYGRPAPPDDPVEELLWIPRILFYPLHLLLDYGVRRPLAWLLTTIEQTGFDQNLGPRSAEPDGDWHWWFRPYGRYDHGFAPSVGLDLYARQRASGSLLGVGVHFWGLDRLGGWAGLRLVEDQTRLRLIFRGGYRVDGLYGGIGWNGGAAPPARYARGRGEGRIEVDQRLWRRSRLEVGARLSVERFWPSGYGQRSQGANAAAMDGVPGFTDGYTPIVVYSRLVLDTREREQRGHGSGARLELGGGWGLDAERGPGASWARAGGVAELSVELRRARTLSVRGLVEVAEPLGDIPIPFTEMVWMGGAWDRMVGFLEGQLIGRSAATLGLRYRYAVWSWVDAVLFYDVGNVFGAGFEDFDVERLRMSFGFALRARDTQDFTALIGFGTAPFVAGADITSVRVAVGIATEP